MTAIKNLKGVLLLTCLLLTGTYSCLFFIYSSSPLTETFVFPGVSTILPCTKLVSSDCSLIFWTFYKGGQVLYNLVNEGQVNADSDKASRMSITSNCFLSISDLRVEDAGSYVCLKQGDAITDVYLSLLTITSLSTITNLQPGGNLTLNCVLFTFYDAGSCKYSSGFNLNWANEDGTMLLKDILTIKLTKKTRQKFNK
uniref:Immunoglobulin V-set domain-containing protein n=1 Tax=Dicentrarchus labrax TaxID=13489 RepID=A0A8C4GJL9_DICLA